MIRLKELTTIRLGMAFKTAIKDLGSAGDFALIQSKDILADGLPNVASLPKVKPTYNPSNHIIKQEEILIRLKGPVFSSAIFNGQYPAITTNQSAVITCNTNELIPLFLNWYLNSQHGKRFFKSINEGTDIAKLSTKALGEMPIELPSLAHQNEIAKVYRNWQQQRAIHQQLIQNGDKMTNGICNTILNRPTK